MQEGLSGFLQVLFIKLLKLQKVHEDARLGSLR